MEKNIDLSDACNGLASTSEMFGLVDDPVPQDLLGEAPLPHAFSRDNGPLLYEREWFEDSPEVSYPSEYPLVESCSDSEPLFPQEPSNHQGLPVQAQISETELKTLEEQI